MTITVCHQETSRLTLPSCWNLCVGKSSRQQAKGQGYRRSFELLTLQSFPGTPQCQHTSIYHHDCGEGK
ncbi:hypothetical protein Ocin01_15764 [Orchesella cincta]|uniref:Uncharacterized protein n=1 Tax=Orchesella cincta TaxID=48709 RepID=A0A1D2MD32_ORCCI|nr:hypothetical protein Ocin01_15764 [Orchesella cincta]